MPVEGELLVVRVRVDVTLPLVGIIAGLGRVTVTPSGAAPFQAAARFTEELKPFTDESTIVVDLEVSDVRVISPMDG